MEALNKSFDSINIYCDSSSWPCTWPMGNEGGEITLDEQLLCAWHLRLAKAVTLSFHLWLARN